MTAYINVLDHGSVELIDQMTTDPRLKIVNAARVSYAKEVTDLSEKDEKLISYLFEHGHFSTFRHSYFTFRVRAPLFVFRQWWKYQVGSEWVEGAAVEIPDTSWNEQSGRYTEFDPVFYTPEVLRLQNVAGNKQGSDGEHPDSATFINEITLRYSQMWATYVSMIRAGVSKEQARLVLPTSIYSECIWTCSLQTIMHFLHQRLKPEAQYEIREYARAIAEILRPSLGALVDTCA